MRILATLCILAMIGCSNDTPPVLDLEPWEDPPFGGTIFIDPDIVTSADKSSFDSIYHTGTGERRMFDRRVNDWIENDAHLFIAAYPNGEIEVQVNSEFTLEEASEYAETYAWYIGQLPYFLMQNIFTVWIHDGEELFGGGNNNILIHVDQGKNYLSDGILEETLIHEATHTSLDYIHAQHPGWVSAQLADKSYISDYARDYPKREDVAESMVPYIAVKYKRDRISDGLADTIATTIPNRLLYFDEQKFVLGEHWK